MAEHSRYQKALIGRYYDRRDEIMLTKLGDIVTELALCDSDAKRQRLWTRAAKAMDTLGVRESIQAHLLAKRDVEVLARHLRDWLKASQNPRR